MLPRLQDYYRSTFGHAVVGGALLWAALPPLGLWPLAWIAPVWWVLLIRRQQLPPLAIAPPRWLRPVPLIVSCVLFFLTWMAAAGWWHGWQYRDFWIAEVVFWPAALGLGFVAACWWRERPYRSLWLAGLLFWLAALHWLRFPHWATGFGWLAMCGYFACYFPLFVGLSRLAVHRLRVPVIVAAPVVWTGLELARAHVLTGMTMASLGHTQYQQIALIQFSDLTGCFGVSFLIVLVAACLARMLPCDGQRRTFWPLAPAVGLLAAALLYGSLRTAGESTLPGGRVALIQGSIDTEMKCDANQRAAIFQQYFELSQEAVQKAAQDQQRVELVVWPETMFRESLITCDANYGQPKVYADWPADKFRQQVEVARQRGLNYMAETARALDAALILGVDRQHFAAERLRFFNSAAFVSREGKLLGYYDKMHRVMFGEYVPLADRFDWLHKLTPLSVSLSAGEHAASFSLGRLRIAPNICFECVLSHVIRRQINELRAAGQEPNVLVSLTNDGWFWGSSELDMHLVCAVFRAVECHKPFVIAANTGFSAWIDGDGRIVQQGPRRTSGTLLADVRLDPRGSWYLDHGDWFAGICLMLCGAFAVLGGWKAFHAKAQGRQGRGKEEG
jgi:apolipoprotein N-acyltransferase